MSGISDTIWAVLIGAVILAVLFILLRPSSPTTTAVLDISHALTALVATAVSNYNGGNNNG